METNTTGGGERITVDMLHDLWPTIVAGISAQNDRLAMALTRSRVGSVRGPNITLVSDYRFYRDVIMEKDLLELVERVIRQLLKQPVSVSVETARVDINLVQMVCPAVLADLKKISPDIWVQIDGCHLKATSSETVILKAGELAYRWLLPRYQWRLLVSGLFYSHMEQVVTVSPVLKQDLATMPYDDYLKTEHWQKTSAAAKERAGKRCQVCNRYGKLHTHHRTYERRGAELPDDLIVLCASCHKLFHVNGKLARRS